MRQTCGRDNFVSGIGLKVQRAEIQANLARNGPDMHPLHRRGESFIIESVPDRPS